MNQEQNTIIPAKSLEELYQNVQIYGGLSKPNLDFYVPMYQKEIDNLSMALSLSFKYNETFYLVGQTGSGKTTTIDYIFNKNEKLQKKYFFLNIDFLNPREGTNLDDPNFHIIEILLILFKKILDEIPEKFDFERDNFKIRLKAIEDEQKIQYKDVAQNHWSFADFLMEGIYKLGLNWGMDASRRETIRKVYQTRTPDILNLLNELITKVNQSLGNQGQTMLIFFDGLEKIKKPEIIDRIFSTDNLFYLKNIDCRKIITTPVQLPFLETQSSDISANVFHIHCKINDNPLSQLPAGLTCSEKVKENRQNMAMIVRNRIHDDHQSIITEDALNLAVLYSGGFMDDFLVRMMVGGIIEALTSGSAVLRKEHIEKVASQHENLKSGTFTGDGKAIKLLYFIQKYHKTPEDDEITGTTFIRQILLNNIIMVFNDVRCYLVHPLIDKTVNVYGTANTDTPESK